MEIQEIGYNGSSNITAADFARQSTVRNNDDLTEECGEQEWKELLAVIESAENADDDDDAETEAKEDKRLLETTGFGFGDINSRLRQINRGIDKLDLRPKVDSARKHTMLVKKNKIKRKASLKKRREKNELYDFCPLCPEDELISEYKLPCLVH